MKKGGYQILNLGEKPITAGSETGITVSRAYDTIESARKHVVVSGLVIGTAEFADFTAEFTVSGTDFVCTAYGYKITVDDDDMVTAVSVPAMTQGAAVADITGDTPTKAEFNGLLAVLRTAGIIATSAEE